MPGDVKFEELGRPPVTFAPFEIHDANGAVVSASSVLPLRQTEADRVQRISEAVAARAQMAESGFDGLGAVAPQLYGDRDLPLSQYAGELNRSEEILNAKGYSLKTEADALAKVHEVQAIDRDAVQVQVNSAKEVFVDAHAPGMRKPATDDAVVMFNKAGHEKPADTESLYNESEDKKCAPASGAVSTENTSCFAANLPEPAQTEPSIDLTANRDKCNSDSPLGASRLITERWSDSGGDSNFGWEATAKFSLSTDAKGLTLDADATVGGKALAARRPLLKSKLMFVSPRQGNAEGTMTLELVNTKIFNERGAFAQNLASSLNAEGKERFVQGREESLFATTWMIGFVPVSLAVSAKVSMGPTYQVDLMPVKLQGRAEWQSRATVIVSAGVGAELKLFQILAGVKGYLDLIDSKFGTFPEAGLVLDEKNKPQVFARVDGRARLRTLSGAIVLGVWAQSTFDIPQPKSSFPFFQMKPIKYEWAKEVGRYPGYDFPEVVFFDKKVGYDVCANRKTVETVVANTPRDHDERESFEVRELARVELYETKVSTRVTAALESERNALIGTKTNELMIAMQALKQEAERIHNVMTD